MEVPKKEYTNISHMDNAVVLCYSINDKEKITR